MSVETGRARQLHSRQETMPGYEAAAWGGARVRVEARVLDAGTNPEGLIRAVREGWQSAIKAKSSPGYIKTLVARFVRASALDVPGSISIDDALEQRFEVALEITCGVCRVRRVTIRPRWPELRDALAPENVPKELRPCESIVHMPNEEVLWEYVQWQSAYSLAEVYARQWITRFSRGVCPECQAAARERIMARLEGLRGVIQENAARREAQLTAERTAAAERVRRVREEQERREEQSPPYLCVSAPPGELGAQVSAWIRRGYEVWGAPVGVEGRITQALIRPGVAPERRRETGSPELLSGVSPPGALSGPAPATAAMGPRESALGSPGADILERPIVELELSTRSFNCLRAHNIHRLKDLVQCTESQLLDMQNLGKRSLADITAALERLGLRAGTRPAVPPLPLEGPNERKGLSDVPVSA